MSSALISFKPFFPFRAQGGKHKKTCSSLNLIFLIKEGLAPLLCLDTDKFLTLQLLLGSNEQAMFKSCQRWKAEGASLEQVKVA